MNRATDSATTSAKSRNISRESPCSDTSLPMSMQFRKSACLRWCQKRSRSVPTDSVIQYPSPSTASPSWEVHFVGISVSSHVRSSSTCHRARSSLARARR
eukprot:2107688-Prymnesium_polylepis.4